MKPRIPLFLLVCALLIAGCGSSATSTPALDINAMNTAIVGTTAAQLSEQFTQTALAAPTNTVVPIETSTSIPNLAVPSLDISGTSSTVNPAALPTFSFANNTLAPGITPLVSPIPSISSGNPSTASGCNDALFIAESLPDGSKVDAEKQFAKSWELQNTGSCTWDEGYAFVFLPTISSIEIKGYDINIKTSDEFTKPGHSQSFIIKLTAPSKAGEYKGYWRMKDDQGSFFGSQVYFDIVVK